MIAEGADIVDVGGESTRPGAEPVPADEELGRVVPVIEALAGEVRVSIDTTKERWPRRRSQAGASLINDVSATLWPAAARLGVGWVAMHRQGTPGSHAARPPLRRRGGEVTALLADRAGRATDGRGGRGVDRPGHRVRQDRRPQPPLLGSLDDLVATGYPVMVGTSRKSFLGRWPPAADGTPAPSTERLPGSLATATWAMQQGARMVRVHDVAPTVQAAVPGRPPSRARRRGRAWKGKWAAGIPPRNFTWVIKDRLAVSERPGGFAPNHRKVRRQEEIIWLQVQGFTRVFSLLPVLPQPPGLRGAGRWPACTSRCPRPATPGASGRPVPRAPRPAGRRRADPHPPGGAGRPGDRGGGRVPAVVGPAAERPAGHHRARAHDRPSHGPERARAGGLRRPAGTRPRCAPVRAATLPGAG